MRGIAAAVALACVALGSATVIDLGKLMPLGDSITEGTGTPQVGGYRGPLYSALRADGFTFTPVGPRTQGGRLGMLPLSPLGKRRSPIAGMSLNG